MKTFPISSIEILRELYPLTQQGYTTTIGLRGRSMRPFLEDNRDKALLGKLETPRVGEPVFAELAPDFFVLHRIVKIDGDNITLLGDGNLRPEHCKMKDLRCRVIGFYRKGRTTLDPVDGWKWKLYSLIWTNIFPLRRVLLKIYRNIWLKIVPQYQLYDLSTAYVNDNNNDDKQQDDDKQKR